LCVHAAAFTHEEMVSILVACDCYQGNAKRMRALVLLLRYSGLRVGDESGSRVTGSKMAAFSCTRKRPASRCGARCPIS
jgi:hypothetical protein